MEEVQYSKKTWFQKYGRSLKVLIPVRCCIKNRNKEVLPTTSVGLFSYISLSWLDKLFWKASRKGVQTEELKRMEDVDEVEKNSKRFAHFWNEELKTHGTEKSSLVRVVLRFCCVRLILVVIVMGVLCISHYIGPAWIMKYFLDFMDDDNAPMSKGITLVALFSVCQILRSVTYSVCMTLGAHTGIRTQAAIQMAIYEKILRLKQGNDKLVGEVINYFTSDMEKIHLMLYNCMYVAGVPILGTLNILYCYQIMGPWSFLANAILVLYFFGMSFVARKIRELHINFSKVSDERISFTTQILSNIKLVKMFAWEENFSTRIEDMRRSEVSLLFKTTFLQDVSMTMPIITILIAPMLSFIGYVLCGGNLTASMAFSIITVFVAIQIALNTVPIAVKSLSEGFVSCQRIQKTLLAIDVVIPAQRKNMHRDEDAVIIDANLSCDINDMSPRKDTNELSNKLNNETNNCISTNQIENMKQNSSISVNGANLHIKKGSLIGICGSIGSGKSTLIAGIIGEATIEERSISVQGTVAVATQLAWIFNATIKDNILFGLPFDDKRYKMVVDACCLEMDLKLMPSGDQTEVGENGVNLSGGQKQRLNLARALYSNRDVYLLDDILSAVDAKVGKHIFQNCIKKALCGKTVLMVTHTMQLLEQCDYIVLMKEGEISERGTHDELIKLNGDYCQMHITDNELRGKNDKDTVSEVSKLQKDNVRKGSNDILAINGTMIKDELDNANKITWQSWLYFAKCCGGFLISALPFFGFLLFCVANVSNVVWLQIWIDAGGGADQNSTANGTSQISNISKNPELHMYILVYCILAIALVISGLVKSFIFVNVFFKGTTQLHAKLFSKVTRCPMTFFDRTPLGRIISRFSRDMDEIESRILYISQFVMLSFALILIRCVLVCVLNAYISIIIGISFVAFILMNVYLNGAVGEMKRMENLLRPPILAHITTTIQGLPVIRCYEKQLMFIEKFQTLVNKHLSSFLLFTLSSNWFALRVEALGCSALITTTIIVLLDKGSTSDSTAGLVLSQMFQVCAILSLASRWKTDLSARFISIERVSAYGRNLLEEAPEIVKENRPLKEWPSKGAITFSNVKLQYDPELPLVLRGVSVNIEGGEKVGLIGRTGAGKSSVIGALMRLTEISEGSVVIDGVDVSKIGLRDLRSQIAVVPQDPVLFKGTVRWNLDPHEQKSDEELWQALDKAHLKEKVIREPQQLETSLDSEGETFSVGEKQLFCLARALLRNNKILVLDEATASIDVETDKLIQETIRQSFTNCTVLTIAHRLNTVADYDKIMAMEDGKVIEFDPPKHLLQKDSLFRSMMKSFAEIDGAAKTT